MTKLMKISLLTIIAVFGTIIFTGCGGNKAPATVQKTGDSVAVAGFRTAQWGMTVEEVKKGEKLKLVKEDSSALIYTGEVYGKQGEVYYFFDESGTLFSATIKYAVTGSDPEAAVNLYNSIKASLVAELGAPSVDEVVLLDSTITADTKLPAEGLATGNKIYTADWNDKPGSQIGIILSKPQESDLSLGVVYQRK